MTESADKTTLSPAFITDSTGVQWGLVPSVSMGAQVSRAGIVQTGTAAVIQLLYLNKVVYQENSSGNWWSWTNGAWVPTTDPLTPPVVVTPPIVTPPPVTESPDGTSVTTAGPAIINAVKESYTLVNSATRGLQVAVNGVVDAPTGMVTLLLYKNHAVYQQNNAGSWWSTAKSTDPWVATTDPRAPAPVVPPSGNLVLVPFGGYVGTWMGSSGSAYYPTYAAHWNGYIAAFGRTPTIFGINTNNTNTDPSQWSAVAQYNINNWAASGMPLTTIPMLSWVFQNASGATIYADVANGLCDTAIQQTLAVYKNNGHMKLYLRPSWEWNINFTGNGINASTLPTFRAAMRHFYTVVQTYASQNGMKIRVCWNPSVYGQPTNGLSVVSQFPNQAAGDHFVDVVCSDFYAEGGSLASDVKSDPTAFTVTGLTAIAKQWNLPIGFCELGGIYYPDDGKTTAANVFVPNFISYLKSIGPTVPIEFVCMFDVGVIPLGQTANIEFTAPAIGRSGLVNAWKAGLNATGSSPIMTLAVP